MTTPPAPCPAPALPRLAQEDAPGGSFDTPSVDGNTDLRARTENFRDLSGDFGLHLQTGSYIQRPDHVTMRDREAAPLRPRPATGAGSGGMQATILNTL